MPVMIGRGGGESGSEFDSTYLSAMSTMPLFSSDGFASGSATSFTSVRPPTVIRSRWSAASTHVPRPEQSSGQ